MLLSSELLPNETMRRISCMGHELKGHPCLCVLTETFKMNYNIWVLDPLIKINFGVKVTLSCYDLIILQQTGTISIYQHPPVNSMADPDSAIYSIKWGDKQKSL